MSTSRLQILADDARACDACRLHSGRTQAVFARGNPLADVCFVGEGPGADEDAQGEPFVGRAGKLLDRMIAAMGYGRNEVYICNVVKCRPPENRKPEADEVGACAHFLTEQITIVDPKVIVALGTSAAEGLIGYTGGITAIRGKWRLYKGRIPVMPTYHPAYLLRQPSAEREMWSDLQQVMRNLGKARAGLTPAQTIQVAARSFSDPRTVTRYIDGLSLTSTRRAAIEAALVALGYTDLVRQTIAS